VPLTEVDILRKVAQNAADVQHRGDKSLGVGIIDDIDMFLDGLKPKDFVRAAGDTSDIASKYKTARKLWGRGRRSELVNKAISKAQNSASGLENGIRQEFRKILRNDKQSRYFNKEELAEMRKVADGTTKANLAKWVGTFGMLDGSATSTVRPILGAMAGGTLMGTTGAVVMPLIGQMSKGLAEKMTKANARMADQYIRAGRDARKIARAYIENTKKANRNPGELAELLMLGKVDDLSDVPNTAFAKEAFKLATQEKMALATAGASALQQTKQEGIQ